MQWSERALIERTANTDPLSYAAAPLVEVRNLIKEYSGDAGVTRVVEGVSFAIYPGETLGLVGESGSGKSTVARMILRLIEPTAGEVLFEGAPLPPAHSQEMRALRRRVQIVFQDPYAALNPRMKVRQILAEPFAIHREAPPEGLDARLRDLLRSVDLDESALRSLPA